MTDDKLRLFSRMLNAFENDSGSPNTDYRSVYLYNDGPNDKKQVTLGRGFTQFGGSLALVLKRYIQKGGAFTPQFTAALLHKFGSTALSTDQDFLFRLKAAASELAMQQAQDEIFNEVYLAPAIKWAADKGFTLPLAYAIVVDSYLHSGGMLKFLMNRFPERKPVDGGDQQAWAKAYVAVRRNWLLSKGKPLSNTLYRMDFFNTQFQRGNWDFDCPLKANGSNLC